METLKHFIAFLALILLSAGCSQQNEYKIPASTNRTSKESDDKMLLDSPMTDPKVLDKLWSAYSETKNTAYVLKIVSMLDAKDNVRARLESWLNKSKQSELDEYRKRMSEWSFPINYQNRTIAGPIDLDLHVALLAKEGKLKFDQLPVKVPMNELVQLSMKSAALWSLLSVAKQDNTVAEICLAQSKAAGGAAREHLASFRDE